MTSEVLRVYWAENLVGELRLTNKRDFCFRYSETWLGRPHGLPLSIRLPLKDQEFSDGECRAFFSNLLPEGNIRSSIARKLGVSEINDFALLSALGGECAGAISLLPEGEEVSTKGDYHPLSQSELDRWIDEMAQTPLLMSQGGQRLSMAGAQQKLPVFIRDGNLFSTKGAAPSSHILKPGVPGYPDIVQNEAFCMRLAKLYGLPVPEVGIRKGKHAVYIIERYDRKKNADGHLTRIHQEDFCQALGFSYSQKYESEGGPNVQKCFSLISDADTEPIIDKRLLLQWIIFNFLIGNYDSHAKNISLLISRGTYRLAPFYDLLSTSVYPNLPQKTAMRIGGENRPDWIFKRHWERLAADAAVSFKAVAEICAEMCERLPGLSENQAGESAEGMGASETVREIVRFIADSAKRTMKTLAAG